MTVSENRGRAAVWHPVVGTDRACRPSLEELYHQSLRGVRVHPGVADTRHHPDAQRRGRLQFPCDRVGLAAMAVHRACGEREHRHHRVALSVAALQRVAGPQAWRWCSAGRSAMSSIASGWERSSISSTFIGIGHTSRHSTSPIQRSPWARRFYCWTRLLEPKRTRARA